MKPREAWELAQLLRRTAAVLRLPAVPPWPDWMTPARCADMAAKYEELADLIEPRRPPSRRDGGAAGHL